MGQEAARGCGFRKVNGLYLVASGLWSECDRLPLGLTHCLACGCGVKFPRAPRKVVPRSLFGVHEECTEVYASSVMEPFNVARGLMPCSVCRPQAEVAYVLGVGERHYKVPGDFMAEAVKLGVSKRIPAVPKDLEIGKTWVYLAHRKACVGPDGKPQLGIFAAFVPQRVEMPVWKSEMTDERSKDLEKRGITPVVFEDGDPDHR